MILGIVLHGFGTILSDQDSAEALQLTFFTKAQPKQIEFLKHRRPTICFKISE